MRMSALPGLDIDLLRSFSLIAEEKSFTRAAERVGRSQSAVSLQIKRLEDIIGHRVFVRGKGGAVQLTPDGRNLLEHSSELLALNDKIVSTLRAQPSHTEVRLGLPEDFTGLDVSEMMEHFRKAHPNITVESIEAPDCALVPLLKAGELDLMLCHSSIEPRGWPSVELWRGRLHWITSERHTPFLLDPLPLSLSPGNCPWRPPWLEECVWRGAALQALDRAGRHYRIVSTSSKITGQHNTVLAGLAVMVAPLARLPAGLRPCNPTEGLPELPETCVTLLKGREPRQPVTDFLATHIISAFQAFSQRSVA
jgi:DNA-binding transcriptional LysR family regulator